MSSRLACQTRDVSLAQAGRTIESSRSDIQGAQLVALPRRSKNWLSKTNIRTQCLSSYDVVFAFANDIVHDLFFSTAIQGRPDLAESRKIESATLARKLLTRRAH